MRENRPQLNTMSIAVNQRIAFVPQSQLLLFLTSIWSRPRAVAPRSYSVYLQSVAVLSSQICQESVAIAQWDLSGALGPFIRIPRMMVLGGKVMHCKRHSSCLRSSPIEASNVSKAVILRCRMRRRKVQLYSAGGLFLSIRLLRLSYPLCRMARSRL